MVHGYTLRGRDVRQKGVPSDAASIQLSRELEWAIPKGGPFGAGLRQPTAEECGLCRVKLLLGESPVRAEVGQTP